MIGNITVDAEQDVFPAARRYFRGSAREPTAAPLKRLASVGTRTVAARRKSRLPRGSCLFALTGWEQVSDHDRGGQRRECSERGAMAVSIASFTG